MGDQIIGVISAGCVEDDLTHVGFDTQVDSHGLLVNVNHLPVGRRPGGQIRHGDLLEVQNPRAPHPPNFWRRCSDQKKLWHVVSSPLFDLGAARDGPRIAAEPYTSIGRNNNLVDNIAQ